MNEFLRKVLPRPVYRYLRRKWFKLIYVYPALADAMLGLGLSQKATQQPKDDQSGQQD